MRTRLRDGTSIEIRPLEPDDRERLAEGFARLSPESRYRRFFGPMPSLRSRDLDYLVDVDHHDHEALMAVDPATGDGVGVARYVRTGPEVAEPALVVVDGWQGRGIGSRLLDELVRRAQAEGVRRFEAPVLASNTEAIRVLERLGRTTVVPQGREVELRIELPPEPGARPSLTRLLGHFAAGAVEPARTVVELVFPRRGGVDRRERRNLIVVGTDGSGHAAAAVATTGELALATGAAVEVIGAHRFLPSDQEATAESVRDAAAELRRRGLHVHEHVRRGDPALVLTDLAEERRARLIVVGAGDLGKLGRRLVGSVADIVSERAPCDVLIVRPR